MDDSRVCYITTRGRETGRPHTIEIWFVAREPTIYILSGAAEKSDTVRNIRAQSQCHVRIGLKTYPATARVLNDPRDAEAVLARSLLPRKYANEEDGLIEWANTALPVAFDLETD